MKTQESGEPEIVVLYCAQSASDGLRLKTSLNGAGFRVRLSMLPCSSKIEESFLLKILEEGADGIELVGCPVEKCRFLVGSVRAEKRVLHARDLLTQAGMSPERLGMTRAEDLTAETILQIAGKRAKAARPLGPNPMKGGKTG
jgi:F420-non-reducing hydrogenase iron-sulfur subunit